MSEAARSRRDGARHEPQVGLPDRDGPADPLAELARLVGQEDPFRRVFRALPAAAPAQPLHGGWEADHVAEDDHVALHDAYGMDRHADRAIGHAGHEVDDRHGGAEGALGHTDDDRYHVGEYVPRGDEAGLADEQFASDEAAASTLPDMWADGEGDVHSFDPAPALPEAGSRGGSSARRPLAVLAAVLVLTGGGLAASFLAKGPSAANTAASPSGRAAPTIMAATGPTKVKVEDTSATAPEDQDAALLNKNAAPSSGPVKIVSSQEQPADLSQLPKTAELAAGARSLPPPAPSPFPEPKKVKTFVVHPDGSMMSGEGAPSPSADAAQPSSPRADLRGGATTPRSAPASPSSPAAPPATIASLAADPTPAPGATRQPASPGARTATAKPNDAADAPASGGGIYGLQLASSPSEADAQAAFVKMKKKYPALLGSLTATIHKAETGASPVYRVRVGGMSQEDAKALCTKLQDAHGSCFVVRN